MWDVPPVAWDYRGYARTSSGMRLPWVCTYLQWHETTTGAHILSVSWGYRGSQFTSSGMRLTYKPPCGMRLPWQPTYLQWHEATVCAHDEALQFGIFYWVVISFLEILHHIHSLFFAICFDVKLVWLWALFTNVLDFVLAVITIVSCFDLKSENRKWIICPSTTFN